MLINCLLNWQRVFIPPKTFVLLLTLVASAAARRASLFATSSRRQASTSARILANSFRFASFSFCDE